MPCIHVDTCYLKDILAVPLELPSVNWLITGLECYDYCGWDGCEKWAERELFLTDKVLRRDVDLRDMQIIWGVFSAIPAEYSREEIHRHPLPESENPYYMSSRIVPQHPLALLELYVEDGCSMLVSARDPAMLEPFYHLPYEVCDEEARNKVMNAQLRRIQDTLRQEVPDVSPEVANEVQWKVWKTLFKNMDNDDDDETLCCAVMKEYYIQILPERNHRTTFWDPYTQG